MEVALGLEAELVLPGRRGVESSSIWLRASGTQAASRCGGVQRRVAVGRVVRRQPAERPVVRV